MEKKFLALWIGLIKIHIFIVMLSIKKSGDRKSSLSWQLTTYNISSSG